MNTKYELLSGDTIQIGKHTLYRIRALKDFGNVKKGTLGGYIETESNLSMYDGAWVADKALVFGDVRIHGNAHVYHNARVYGNADVSDNARIYGNAHIYGNVYVYGYTCIYGNTQVFGRAHIYGNARVYGDAHIGDNAHIYGNAHVFGDAYVSGEACIYDNARVHQNTRVYHNSHIYGNAYVYGNAHIYGNAHVYDNAHVSDCANVYDNARIAENIEIRYGNCTYDLTNNKNPSMAILHSMNYLTVDGKVILYKKVNKINATTFSSVYDEDFIYKLGEVSEDKNADLSMMSCAKGLHASAPLYLVDDGDIIIQVEINIKDIICVQEGKVRCKKLKVIGIAGE